MIRLDQGSGCDRRSRYRYHDEDIWDVERVYFGSPGFGEMGDAGEPEEQSSSSGLRFAWC